MKSDCLFDGGDGFLNVQVSVEPGITIGFLNRLLVAEGLTLGVVPEVSFYLICTIVPTSSLVYHTASVTLILVAVSNDNNH